MILGKEASIIADSTVSSSPPRAADASPQIKRATRTYGKRREEPLADGTAASAWYATSSSENIHKTAPPGLKETIPASSPMKIPVDHDALDTIMRDDTLGRRHNAGHIEKSSPGLERDSHSEQGDPSPKYNSAWRGKQQMDIDNSISEVDDSQSEQEDSLQRRSFGWREKPTGTDRTFEDDIPAPTPTFCDPKLISEEGDFQSEQENPFPRASFGWKEKLEAIDKVFADDTPGFTSNSDKPKDSLSFGKYLLLQEVNAGRIQPGSTGTRALTPPRSVSEDVFNAPPSTLPPFDTPQSPFSLSSPPALPARCSRRPGQHIRDSDSEEERQKGSSSTAPSTSGHNYFVSMKSRSSSTQPTSDEDMPPKIFVNQKLSHSRKLDSSRVSAPPFGVTKLSSKKGRQSKQTIKAPSKKELRETVKERSRLAAQVKVAVPRAETSLKYTVENLLRRVSGQPSQNQVSDPIEPFTSPIATAPSPKELAHPNPISLPERAETPHLLDDPDDSEDELPEITDLLREDSKKRYAEGLKKMKQRVLEQQIAAALQDSEDDDLVISTDPKTMIKEEAENRRSKQPKRSLALRTVAQLAHVNPAVQAKKLSILSPNRIRKDFPSLIQDVTVSGSSADLQRIMFAQVKEHEFREIKRKEEEWTRHGGHLAQKPVALDESFESAVKAIAGKGLEMVKARKSGSMEAEGDSDTVDDEDEDWCQGLETKQDQSDGSERQETMLVDGDITMVAEEQNSDADTTRVHKSRRNLVLSDSDEEAIGFSPSLTSGLATEDEYDKENNTKLMYDQGEDKENKKVVRHQPASKRYTIFDVTDATLSSPESPPRNFCLDGVNSATRKPFQELLSEGPKSTLESTQTFVSKLQQASPLASTLASAPALKPFLPEGSSFAELSQVELEAFGAAPLQPGFSDLFESSTEKRKLPLNLAEDIFEESISDENSNATKLQRSGTLDLTQDVAAAIQLQPAFQAEDSLVRKAEGIFEKEQAFVIEANKKKLTRQHTELYVNELGFLTQTRPVDGTPEIYHRVSSPTPSQRMPLQTLSLATPSQLKFPKQEPFRRLRRAIDTSPRIRIRSLTPSLPVRQLDAHEILRRAQQTQQRKEARKRKRAEIGILFEDEAAESDDDDMFGFAIKKPADDEEDGEDLDQNLPALVDDQKMDADTEAAELVLDKYKEHLEEDDKKLEDLHQAAVQGQLRQKRNRGVGIDDSDDDSDADDNERARRAMKRARKSDRTDIKGLEANEETRAFADSYNQCLRDDDEDFSFLEKQFEEDFTDGREEDDNGDTDGTPDETIDVSEVHKTIKEKAREGRLEAEAIDPKDISWLEQDENMEDVPRVKNVNTRQVRKSREISDLETGIPFWKSPTRMNQASKQWFTEESKTRNASTARKNGGLAVTGHKKRDQVNKGHASSSSLPPVRQVKAAASALSIIADKSGSFA